MAIPVSVIERGPLSSGTLISAISSIVGGSLIALIIICNWRVKSSATTPSLTVISMNAVPFAFVTRLKVSVPVGFALV